MDRHHEDCLTAALDEIYLYTTARVSWDDLYLWFGAKRLAKGSWRQIQQRWEDRCERRWGIKPPSLSLLSKPRVLIISRELIEDEKRERLEDWAD